MDPIYCIRDAFRIGRYIGVTCKLPEDRLAEHLAEARGRKRTHKLNWLRSQTELPTIEVLEWVLPMRRNATSKFHGVSWHAPVNKWRAILYINRRQACIGTFKNEIDAAKAVDAAVIAWGLSPALLNFP